MIMIMIIIIIIIIIIQCIYRASFPYSSKTPNDLLCLFSEARTLPFCEATLKKSVRVHILAANFLNSLTLLR